MNAEIKAKWLEALRSGKYRQGTEYLRTADDKFCCLGVLCDITNPALWEKWTNGERHHDVYGFLSHTSMLPDKIDEQAGGIAAKAHLMGMNDSGKSFSEIANYIEANL